MAAASSRAVPVPSIGADVRSQVSSAVDAAQRDPGVRLELAHQLLAERHVDDDGVAGAPSGHARRRARQPRSGRPSVRVRPRSPAWPSHGIQDGMRDGDRRPWAHGPAVIGSVQGRRRRGRCAAAAHASAPDDRGVRHAGIPRRRRPAVRFSVCCISPSCRRAPAREPRCCARNRVSSTRPLSLVRTMYELKLKNSSRPPAGRR